MSLSAVAIVGYVFHGFCFLTYGFNAFQHVKLVPASTTSTGFARTGLAFILAGVFSSIVEIIFYSYISQNSFPTEAVAFLLYLGFAFRSILVLAHAYVAIRLLEGQRDAKSQSKEKKASATGGDEEAAADSSAAVAEGTTEASEAQPPAEADDTVGAQPQVDTTEPSREHEQPPDSPKSTAKRAVITITLPLRSVSFVHYFFIATEIIVAIVGIIVFWVEDANFRNAVQAFAAVVMLHASVLVFRLVVKTARMHSPIGFPTLKRGADSTQATTHTTATLNRVAQGIDAYSRPLRLAAPFFLLAIVIVTESARLAGDGLSLREAFDGLFPREAGDGFFPREADDGLLEFSVFGAIDAWHQISQWFVAVAVVMLVFAVKHDKEST